MAPAPNATSRIEASIPASRIPARRPCAVPPLRLMPKMVGTPGVPPLCMASASSTARPHPSLSPPTKFVASASHSPLRRTSWSSPMTTMSAMACPMMLAATRGGMANLASAGISWQAAKTHPDGSRPSKPPPLSLPRALSPPRPAAGYRGRPPAPLPKPPPTGGGARLPWLLRAVGPGLPPVACPSVAPRRRRALWLALAAAAAVPPWSARGPSSAPAAG